MSEPRINDENAPPSNSNGGTGNNYESLMERINRLKANKVEAPQKNASSPTDTEQGWDQLPSKTGTLSENETQKRFVLVQDVKKNETNPKHWMALIQFDLQKWKEDRTADGLKNLIRLYQKATSTVDLLAFRKTEELCELWIGYAKVLSMTSPTEARETYQYIGTEIGQDSPNYYKSYAAFEVKNGNKDKAKNIIAKGLQRRVLTQQHIAEFAALSAKDASKEPPSTPKPPSLPSNNVPMTPTQPHTESITPSPYPVTPAAVQSTSVALTPAPQVSSQPITPLPQPVTTSDSAKREDAFKRPAIKKPFGSLGLTGGARRVKVDESPNVNTDTLSPDSAVSNVLSPQTEEVNMASRPQPPPENLTHPQTYPSKPRTPRANKKQEDESKAEVHSGTIKTQDPATPEAPKINPQLMNPSLLVPSQPVLQPVSAERKPEAQVSPTVQTAPAQLAIPVQPATQPSQSLLPQVSAPIQPVAQPSQTSPITLPSSERPPLATYGAPLSNNNPQPRHPLKRSSSDIASSSSSSTSASLPPQPHTTPLRPAVPTSNGIAYGSNTPVQSQQVVQQQSSRTTTPQQRPAVQPAATFTPQGAPGYNNNPVASQGTQPSYTSPEAPINPFDIVRQWSDMAFEVNGRLYVKLECVGKGGSSKVYKVMDQDLKTYALKRVNLDGAEGASGLVESYLNEILLLKSLRGHKNIIHFVDSEIKQAENVLYMILEFGEIDLARLIQQQGESFNKNYLRVVWQQMLESVHTVHEERIVHSDLKPANFVFVKGSLKLIDFGIAKAISSDTTNIMRDSTIGTINYMSPEAFININDGSGQQCMKLGRSSDIWSLGCILYQMVYGKTPFAHLTNMYQKVKCIPDPKYPIQYPKINDPLLTDVLKRCLQRDPKKRATIPELLAHPFLNPSELICSQCCKLIQPS